MFSKVRLSGWKVGRGEKERNLGPLHDTRPQNLDTGYRGNAKGKKGGRGMSSQRCNFDVSGYGSSWAPTMSCSNISQI
jgi:hypothetical protein